MEFPYKYKFVDNIQDRFQKLIGYKSEPQYKTIRSRNNFFHYSTNSVFNLICDDYYIDILSDVFNEKERIKTRKLGKNSLIEIYEKILLPIFEEDEDLTEKEKIERMREWLYKNYSKYEATQFKPTLAISIYKYAKPMKILDMSAGWGDRLIAAIAYYDYMKKPDSFLYHAFDPNINLKEGHDNIISTFNAPRSKFKIEYKGFEDSVLDDDYDLFFSSPPFFDLEEYSKDKSQSIIKYKKFDNWLINFLFFCLKKAKDRLRDKGVMIIHISDYNQYIFTEKMIFYLECIGMKFIGIINHLNNSKGIPRTMFYFKKDNVDIEEKKSLFNKYYPNLYKLITF